MKIDQTLLSFHRIRFLMLVFCTFLLSCCSGNHNTSDNTGALAIKFVYHGSADEFQTQSAKMDCDQEGVETIEAAVFNADNKRIADGGPWQCKEGRGTITSVTAGKDRTVVIWGRDKEKNVVFRGERSGIAVVAKQTSKAEDILCTSFVPNIQLPVNSYLVRTGVKPLRWEGVEGATSYQVIVSKNNDLSDHLLDTETPQTNYSLSSVIPDLHTYYWQIKAIDAYGNVGTGSQIGIIGSALHSPVAAGEDHTIAIKPDGTLWSWGRNQFGQLGLGDMGDGTEQTSPAQINSDADWIHVTAGPHHCLAIKSDGTLWGWGRNANSVLGLGSDTSERTNPTRVGKDKDWAYVAAGDYHTVAIKQNGELWAWGLNNSGQLGRDDTQQQSRPTYIEGDDWAFVAAGAYHTLAINTKGELWAWGNNNQGQLGLGEEKVDRLIPYRVDTARDWIFVATSGNRFNPDGDSVYTSGSHTVAIKTSGELWSWGDNTYSQLGYDGQSELKPVHIGTDEKWSYAAATQGYTLAVKQNGELWSWGRNGFGQLGVGDRINRTSASKTDLSNSVFTSTRGKHTVAMDSDGIIWCWGKNAFGEIGNATMGRISIPKQVKVDTDWRFIASSDNNDHTLAIDQNNQLWAWGRNKYGQLGIDSEIFQKQKPSKVDDGGQWKSVAVDGTHTVAIKNADNGRTLWAWGWGYLGNGSKAMEFSPIRIGTDQGWSAISCGVRWTLAIMVKGTEADPKHTIWSWGENGYGQLGLGDSGDDTKRDVPTQIGTGTDWRAVSAGKYHGMAIKTNGTLWSWGYNYFGQLGHDNTDSQFVPKLIGTADDNDWEKVSSGSHHTLAIKTDGTLWSWGYNEFGQLGRSDKEGEKNTLYVPTQVDAEKNSQWNDVAAGRYHTVAIKSDGTLWGWGRNNAGQIGEKNLGSNAQQPTQIGTGDNWKSVAVGWDYSVAIKTDNTCWAWGENINGQLGVGTPWEELPVLIPLE